MELKSIQLSSMGITHQQLQLRERFWMVVTRMNALRFVFPAVIAVIVVVGDLFAFSGRTSFQSRNADRLNDISGNSTSQQLKPIPMFV